MRDFAAAAARPLAAAAHPPAAPPAENPAADPQRCQQQPRRLESAWSIYTKRRAPARAPQRSKPHRRHSPQAATDEGKGHATELANSLLTAAHAPALPLGALDAVPGLRRVAAAKALERARAARARLAECAGRLAAALDGLAAAVGDVRAAAEREELDPLLAGAPVFSALPLAAALRLLGEIEAMYAAEMLAKRAALAGFGAACADAEARHAAGGAGAPAPPAAGAAAAEAAAALEARLRVLIAAWMLEAEVDAGRAAESLAALTADADSV